jgi:DNA-binding IclR family transcriptional regulator
VGNVMLAFDPDGTIPEGPFERITPRTITSAKKLASELAEIRRRGWALSDTERYDDVAGVAAPVLGVRAAADALSS